MFLFDHRIYWNWWVYLLTKEDSIGERNFLNFPGKKSKMLKANPQKYITAQNIFRSRIPLEWMNGTEAKPSTLRLRSQTEPGVKPGSIGERTKQIAILHLEFARILPILPFASSPAIRCSSQCSDFVILTWFLPFGRSGCVSQQTSYGVFRRVVS